MGQQQLQEKGTKFLCVIKFFPQSNQKTSNIQSIPKPLQTRFKIYGKIGTGIKKDKKIFQFSGTHKIGTELYRAPLWLGAPQKFNGFLVHPY